MKTIIYQQADTSIKQPEIILQFPDAPPESDVLHTEYAEYVEEIHIILKQALLEQIKQEESV